MTIEQEPPAWLSDYPGWMFTVSGWWTAMPSPLLVLRAPSWDGLHLKVDEFLRVFDKTHDRRLAEDAVRRLERP